MENTAAKRAGIREIELEADENGALYVDEERYPRSEFSSFYEWLEEDDFYA